MTENLLEKLRARVKGGDPSAMDKDPEISPIDKLKAMMIAATKPEPDFYQISTGRFDPAASNGTGNSVALSYVTPKPTQVVKLVPKAGKWRATGNSRDFGEACAVCELCDQHGLRYYFEIANEVETKWVGSECITKFADYYHPTTGKLLDRAQTKKQLAAEIKAMREAAVRRAEAAKLQAEEVLAQTRYNAAVASLEALCDAEIEGSWSDTVCGITDSYNKYGMSIKQAKVIVWRLHKYKIDHDPQDFVVTIGRHDRQAVIDLKDFQLRQLWAFLTSEGQMRCRAFRRDAGKPIAW